MKDLFKGRSAEVVHTVFQSLLVTYLILLLLEQLWTKSVSSYLNLTYLLIAVLIVGVLSVFSEKQTVSEGVNWKHYVLVGVLGVLGFVLIKYKTEALGWLSWVISIIAGILIILLSLLILEDES